MDWIAISAMSFTISCYSLYVLPKLNCNTSNDCACEITIKEKRKTNINKVVFWIGIFLSIAFLTYFEYSKYQQATSVSFQYAPSASVDSSENCCSCGDSSACEPTSLHLH